MRSCGCNVRVSYRCGTRGSHGPSARGGHGCKPGCRRAAIRTVKNPESYVFGTTCQFTFLRCADPISVAFRDFITLNVVSHRRLCGGSILCNGKSDVVCYGSKLHKYRSPFVAIRYSRSNFPRLEVANGASVSSIPGMSAKDGDYTGEREYQQNSTDND